MKKINISKKSIIIFGSVQLIVAILSFILFGLIPVHKEVSSISKKIAAKSEVTNTQADKQKKILLDQIRSIEHHEAYLKSTLKLSRTDSISLLFDLSDSLVFLSLKGVYLFQSKISKIEISNGLKKLPYFLRDSLYSGPLKVEQDISSIEKFPIVVKKAPKDTTEASQAGTAPTLPIQNDVFVLLSFGNNMVIEIAQQEKELAGTAKAYRQYKRQYSKFYRSKNFHSLFNSQNSGYTYRFRIEIPREDARSIYRALPIKPYVVVRY